MCRHGRCEIVVNRGSYRSVVVLVLAVGVRTELVRSHSTAGFPVVPATRRAVLDLDGVVLGHQAEFLEQRQVAAAEVSEVVTWIWSGHGPTVARHHRRPANADSAAFQSNTLPKPAFWAVSPDRSCPPCVPLCARLRSVHLVGALSDREAAGASGRRGWRGRSPVAPPCPDCPPAGSDLIHPTEPPLRPRYRRGRWPLRQGRGSRGRQSP